MEDEDTYDYSATAPHLTPFEYPVTDEPFITEMPENYGKLWEFKDHIHTWSFGVNRFKNYVFLRYRAAGRTNYLQWNVHEKVSIIESQRDDYVVIVLRAVDDDGKVLDHCHSIVIDVNKSHGKFDLDNLIAFLEGSDMASLNDDFEKLGYVPWLNGTAKSNADRLMRIYQTLDHYAMEHVERRPAVGKGATRSQKNTSTPRAEKKNTGGGSGGRKAKPSEPRTSTRKRDATEAEGEGSSRKRKRSLTGVSGAVAAGGSSGSALTTVSTPAESLEKIPEFEKIAKIQQAFWAEHEALFLHDMAVKTVHIDQCILAKDEYVIRTLQRDILEDVKASLIRIIDVKQRQNVCLTPVDANNKLLQKRPETWEEIMGGKFMIINGQHSIFASKELQNGGCGATRRDELRTWGAYIVWTRNANQLRNISKYYNCTNHLDHAQPTWGNQIISCRNIWTTYKRPTSDKDEATARKNNAFFSLVRYKVTSCPFPLSSGRRYIPPALNDTNGF